MRTRDSVLASIVFHRHMRYICMSTCLKARSDKSTWWVRKSAKGSTLVVWGESTMSVVVSFGEGEQMRMVKVLEKASQSHEDRHWWWTGIKISLIRGPAWKPGQVREQVGERLKVWQRARENAWDNLSGPFFCKI